MEYFIGDTHFFHDNILTFDGRPFIDTHQMFEYMKAEWNDVVTDQDVVYILGDFCWSRDPDVVQGLLRQLNGRKRLIKGNHDQFLKNASIKKEFETIRDYDEIRIGNNHVVLQHFPIASWKNMHGVGNDRAEAWIHLHGHTHMTREFFPYLKYLESINTPGKAPLKAYNVGCMCPWIYYQPKTLEQIITGFEKWHQKYKGV